MKFTAIAAAATLLAAPAFADGHATGDAEAGEKVFKKCKSCHMIEADDGTAIQKGGKTGPNLYGVYQRVPGSVEGFKYGNSIASFGENGIMEDGWNEADFIVYVADPKEFLKEKLGDDKAKTKMTYKLKKEEDAIDLWAYLVSVGPEPKEDSGS